MDKMGAYTDSVEASLNRLQNAWEQLTQQINKSGWLKTVYNTTASLVKHLPLIITQITSLATALNVYKIGGKRGLFGSLVNFFPNTANTLHMNMAGSRIQEGGRQSIVSTGFIRVQGSLERLITIANNIAVKVGAQGVGDIAQITPPGFMTLGGRIKQNNVNIKQINRIKNRANSVLTIDNGGAQMVISGEKRSLTDYDKEEIAQLKRQNRFNRRWGLGLGYSATNSAKEQIFATRQWGKWVDSKGDVIADKDALASLNAQRGQLIKNSIKTGLVTGVISGVTAGLSGTNSTFGDKIGSKDVKINDIESDDADKWTQGIATGAATGLLSAIPGVGQILGPVLGPIIGDGIGGLFKYIRHRDEIERKQRVEDAKKQLEALNSIEGATDGVKDAVYDLSTAEKAKAAKEKVDTLITEIYKSGLENELKAAGVDVNSLEKTLLSATDDADKDKTLAQIYSVLKQWQAKQKYASQEDDRVSIEETYQKELKELEEKKKEKGWSDDDKEYLQELKKIETKRTSSYKELDRQIWNDQLEAAYNESGVAAWDVNKVRGGNLEDVVQIMANKLELTGQKVRKENGELTDTARTQIETFLRGTEKFNTYFNTSAKTLYQMEQDRQVREKLAEKYEMSYEDLVKKFTTQDKSFIDDLKGEYGDAFVSELQTQVLGATSQDLETFANALNITTGKALTLQNQLGNLSSVEVLKNPAELREWGNELVSIFAEISTKGKATGETLEKLNSKFFFLYNKYDANGKLSSTSQDNVLDNLMQLLFSPNNTISYLYRNSEFQEFAKSTDFFDALKQDEDFKTLLKDIGKENATTLTEVDSLLYDNAVYQEKVGQLLSQVADSSLLYREMAEKLSEWQKHENQVAIDNFKSQIDALKDINKERQNEIDLIKAKEALQNAQNEKKRVYRTGVGWTYEADQQAVEEARDKLSELENQKSAEDLQYQIDLLEQQNSILDNISKNEELEALKKNFDSYSTFMRDEFGHAAIGSFELIKRAFENNGAELHVWDNYMADAAQKEDAAKKTAESNVINSIRGMVTNKENMDHYVRAFSNNKTGDNSKVIESQQNIYNYYNELLEAVDTLKNTYGYSDNDIKKTIINSGMSDIYAQSALSLLGDKDAQNVTFSSSKVQAALKGETELFAKKAYDEVTQTIKYESDKVSFFPSLVGASGPYNTFSVNTLSGKQIGYFYQGREEELGQEQAVIADGLMKKFGGDKNIVEFNGKYYYKNSNGKWVTKNAKIDASSVDENALGTYDFEGGPSLINEFGTEGIITPQGTLTALPAHTGVVPADLTRNLYNLGEVAPTLIKRMGSTDNILNSKSLVTNEDNSMNVEQLNASFNVDSDFDFNQLLVQARQYMAMTKNKRI